MAIKAAYQASNGASGNFWVARSVYISPDNSHCRLFFDLFTSQGAYVSGASAIYGQDFLMTGAANAFSLSTLAGLEEARLVTANGVAPFVSGTVVSGFP